MKTTVYLLSGALLIAASMGGCPMENSDGPQAGACCLIDGTCVEVNSAECDEMMGVFTAGTACADVTCALPTAADVKRYGELFESELRNDYKFYFDTMSIIGREYWDLNGDVPALTGELLGKGGAELDPAGFLVHENFAIQFRIIRRANMLILAAQNAEPPLTQQQIDGTMGFAQTIQAYSLLLVLNQQFNNGILPIEQIDSQLPQNQFPSYADSLQYIADRLDSSATLLTNGGPTFVFDDLTVAFAGFSTPATFRQFNRAISARVRIYQGDKPGAISGIAGSFFNINGAMSNGPKFVYSFERRNPMFREHDVDLMTVHPDYIADADPGDLRVSGNARMYVPSENLVVPVTFDGLAGDRQLNIVKTDTMPFSIFTNAELILIYAEAQIGSDVNESLAAINRVRNAAGLGNYLGATDDASMLNEVIKQRRYALFGLGHRWIDLRRTGKFGQINIDRPGDIAHIAFPRPTDLKGALGQ